MVPLTVFCVAFSVPCSSRSGNHGWSGGPGLWTAGGEWPGVDADGADAAANQWAVGTSMPKLNRAFVNHFGTHRRSPSQLGSNRSMHCLINTAEDTAHLDDGAFRRLPGCRLGRPSQSLDLGMQSLTQEMPASSINQQISHLQAKATLQRSMLGGSVRGPARDEGYRLMLLPVRGLWYGGRRSQMKPSLTVQGIPSYSAVDSSGWGGAKAQAVQLGLGLFNQKRRQDSRQAKPMPPMPAASG